MDIPIWAHRGGAVVSTLVVVVAYGRPQLVAWRPRIRSWAGWPGAGRCHPAGWPVCWVVTTQAFELWSTGNGRWDGLPSPPGHGSCVGTPGSSSPGQSATPKPSMRPSRGCRPRSGSTLTRGPCGSGPAAGPGHARASCSFGDGHLGSRHLSGDRGVWPSRGASIVAGLGFVQTAWFSTFLAVRQRHEHDRGGRAARHADRSGDRPRITDSCSWCSGGRRSQANAWPLLVPVAALGCLPWSSSFLRVAGAT